MSVDDPATGLSLVDDVDGADPPRSGAAAREGSVTPFRPEAVAHHGRAFDSEGRPLAITPRWARRAIRVMLATLALAAAWAALGSVDQYAGGRGVVRLGGRTPVTATESATVGAVAVGAGDRVERGATLVRLHGVREAEELDRIRRELDLALGEHLLEPGDRAAARAVADLRSELARAEARLDERTLLAPAAGTVTDVRVVEGSRIEPGDHVLSIAGDRTDPEVVALLPGRYRPLLEPGSAVRFELAGFPDAAQRLRLYAVGDEVLPRSEAERLLGPHAGPAPASAADGPVVVVRARLQTESFRAGGASYRYHDGMRGLLEARVRSRRLLHLLVPGLGGTDG